MKKLFTILLLLNSFLFADIIADKTKIFVHNKARNINAGFKFGNTFATCLNNVVYYLEFGFHENSMSTSYNPITNRPYFCLESDIKMTQEKNWKNSNNLYSWIITIHHEYPIK